MKAMIRRHWLVLPLVLAGCGRIAELPPDLFPADAAGGWRRTEMRDLSVSDAPDPVPRNEIERLREAVYTTPAGGTGAPALQVRIYQLQSAAMGLELVQRWRPSADTVFFNSGRYFVVVKWQSADRAALQAFIRELQQRLARLPK